MASSKYQGLHFQGGVKSEVEDALAEEGALQIVVNDEVFSITMRTPGNDIDLVRGLLYLEDVYTQSHTLEIREIPASNSVLDKALVEIDKNQLGEGYSNSRNLLSVSSCGICGKTTLENLTSTVQLTNQKVVEVSKIKEMFVAMRDAQNTFAITGGSHAAAAFTLEGRLLSLREDIGRHNAVDKVVGHLLVSNQLKMANVLLLSGRISYELIAKAFKAKIPVVAAISAPSTLAVDFAKELGITILGFCREDRATCYAHPQRIIE